jgi:hypothetical protein
MSTCIIAGDIDLNLIGKGESEFDKAYSIMHPFNRSLKRITNLCVSKLRGTIPDELLDTLKRMQMLVRIMDDQLPFFMLARCYKHIVNASDPIENRSKQYFIDRDYSPLIKKDKYMQMIRDLVHLIKSTLDKTSDDELNEIWDLGFVLLVCSMKFKEHTIEYPDVEYGQNKPELDTTPSIL